MKRCGIWRNEGWGDGEMGGWGDGEMVRWGEVKPLTLITANC
ncbi:MAG: hypothetical protein WBA39_29870 [Rivularia sp. (in: cyanobacteria)]